MSKTYFSYLFKAARTALAHPRHVELIQWIGTGPSIRARARFALVAAFLVTTPTLFIGVMQTDGVSKYAQTLDESDLFWQKIDSVRLSIESVRTAIWRYEAQPEIENERLLLQEVQNLRVVLFNLHAKKPKGIESKLSSHMGELSIKLENSVLEGLRKTNVVSGKMGRDSIYLAHLILMTLSRDTEDLEKQVREIILPHRQLAIEALSKVGRNQLILFLILLFSIPVFVGFVPGWLVSPLVRLKSIEQRIEQGRIRDLGISGRDEISQLAITLRHALILREELDQRKSAKIFEIRNVLRAVINHVAEPILIIDKTNRINYANESAACLIETEIHRLEGSGLQEHIFAPELEQALIKAQQGDISTNGLKVTLEMSSGRSETLIAHFASVHERQGGISRVVIVLSKPNSEYVVASV